MLIGVLKPFTERFPRADIHELIAPDLLHQVIKGTFKDHLVEWVLTYIKSKNSKDRAAEIITDIDERCVSRATTIFTITRTHKLSSVFAVARPSPAYVASSKDETSSNGQVMILRP